MSKTQIRTTGILSAIVALAVMSMVLLLSSQRAARALALLQPTPAVTEADLRFALHRVSLDPERLTAAGLSGSDAAGIVEHMHEHLTQHPGPAQYDASVGQVRAQVRQLEHFIGSGQGTQEDVATLASARSDLASAEAARDAAFAAMVAAALDDLSVEEEALLATIRANSSWSLPIEFLAIEQSEPERVGLRDALANEKIAARNGEEPDPDAQAFLAQVRGDSTVSLAKANLDTNLPVVTTAVEAALVEATQSP